MKNAYLVALMAVALGGVAKGQEWYESMKLKGDVRYRYENINDETKKEDQQRDRVRLRVGLEAKANANVDVGLRLTSSSFENGGGDSISGNQTLTGAGSKKGVFIDAAYINYHPSEMIPGLNLILGKQDNPLIAVSDNIWDKDYCPEGIAAKYKVGDEFQFLANASYNWLSENAEAADAKQYNGQVALRYGTDDDHYAMFGATYSATKDLEGMNVLDNQGKQKSFGNATKKVVSGTTTNAVYASEFTVVEGFVEAGTVLGSLPSKVYASYTQNQDADDDDTGYIAGFLIGRAKDPGTFEVGYNYRDLEKNAVLGALTDSDAGGGGTNYKGHKIHAGYAFMKNWAVNASYFMDQKDPDGKDTSYDRLQIDLNAKF